jgi:hypothetical protein
MFRESGASLESVGKVICHSKNPICKFVLPATIEFATGTTLASCNGQSRYLVVKHLGSPWQKWKTAENRRLSKNRPFKFNSLQDRSADFRRIGDFCHRQSGMTNEIVLSFL